MFAISAALSIGLIFMVYRLYSRPTDSIQLILFWLSASIVGGCLLYLPWLTLHSMLLVVTVGLCKLAKRSSNTAWFCMIFAGLTVYGGATWLAYQEYERIVRLRSQYPFISIADRLVGLPEAQKVPLSEETEDQIWRLEEAIGDGENSAPYLLRSLHEFHLKTFMELPGFGIGRAIQPRDEWIRRLRDHDGTLIRQPEPSIWPLNVLGDSRELHEFLFNPMRETHAEPLRDLHLDSVVDFANPRGFGYVRSRQEVAGFQAHQFQKVPESKAWKIQTLELVGLLMHDKPVVYVSDNLPNMDELKELSTKPLNTFETDGLEKLRAGEDLFIRETSDSILMLGAVRNVEQCIPCHAGQRGDLLGAFSYRLQRLP